MANPEYYKAMAFRPSHRKGVEFQVVKWQPLYSRAQVRAPLLQELGLQVLAFQQVNAPAGNPPLHPTGVVPQPV